MAQQILVHPGRLIHPAYGEPDGAAPAGCRLDFIHDRFAKRDKLQRRGFEVHAPGLRAAEEQHIGHQRVHAAHGGFDAVQMRRPPFRRQPVGIAQENIRGTQNDLQRRADFVRDHGGEVGLEPVEFLFLRQCHVELGSPPGNRFLQAAIERENFRLPGEHQFACRLRLVAQPGLQRKQPEKRAAQHQAGRQQKPRRKINGRRLRLEAGTKPPQARDAIDRNGSLRGRARRIRFVRGEQAVFNNFVVQSRLKRMIILRLVQQEKQYAAGPGRPMAHWLPGRKGFLQR